MGGSGLQRIADLALFIALVPLVLWLNARAETAAAEVDAARETAFSVAAQRGTPTATPRPGLETIRGPRNLEAEPTATSTPNPKPEIRLPRGNDADAEPMATPTRTPEPPEICRDKRGNLKDCDAEDPDDPGEGGDGNPLSGCVMMIDVLSGSVEEVSEECEEFEDNLPGASSGNAATSGSASALISRSALFPGKRIVGLETYTAPTSLVEIAVSATLGQVKVHVDRGQNASTVVFPSALGIPPLRFTVPDMDWEAEWWHPQVSEYPNDIDSNQVSFQLENRTDDYPRGFLRLVVKFEENDEEIHGTWHGQMDDMRLSVLLGLRAQDGKVSYSEVNTRFEFDLNMIGLPDWAADPVFGYSESIEQTVEESVAQLFDSQSVRAAFANRITAQLTPFLGPNPVITSVRVTDSVLTIRYYNQ